jgi:hypothetical protein
MILLWWFGESFVVLSTTKIQRALTDVTIQPLELNNLPLRELDSQKISMLECGSIQLGGRS